MWRTLLLVMAAQREVFPQYHHNVNKLKSVLGIQGDDDPPTEVLDLFKEKMYDVQSTMNTIFESGGLEEWRHDRQDEVHRARNWDVRNRLAEAHNSPCYGEGQFCHPGPRLTSLSRPVPRLGGTGQMPVLALKTGGTRRRYFVLFRGSAELLCRHGAGM